MPQAKAAPVAAPEAPAATPADTTPAAATPAPEVAPEVAPDGTTPGGAEQTTNGAVVSTNNDVEVQKPVEPEYTETDLGNGTVIRTYTGVQAYATVAE